MVVQILVAQRQPEHPLAHQRLQAMLDEARVAPVGEAAGKPPDQAQPLVQLPQQQCSGVGCDRPAVEACQNLLAFYRFKLEQPRATVCGHRGFPLDRDKLLLHNNFLRIRAPMHPSGLRNPG